MSNHRHWTSDTNARARAPLDAAERALLRDAERIAEEVAAMTPEDVADYLVSHDLQDLVAPSRIDALLVRASEQVVRRRQADGPRQVDPQTVAAVLDGVRRPADLGPNRRPADGDPHKR